MFLKRGFQICTLLLICNFSFAQSAKDTKIPYTVGDREILLEIKLKLGAYQETMDAKLDAMNAKLDAQQKFINAKLDAQQKSINTKLDAYQEATDAKLDSMNARLSFLESLMITMIGIIIAGMTGLGTYLIWTQKRERQLAQAQTQTPQSDTITRAELENILKPIRDFQKQQQEPI